ncbi:uncharacterized protein Z519_00977 [Cladophialophora bantiana CBS 173.52]|uniref:Uncharacterized protein n=1 Tax=Cladophialophora bantiana (strain ATCC 10958 / CBS 173.52 / CDC B-1940 / NIH 8579) TaxID=1442370 RepID=A0A0D2IRC7_CLAB1|nr:uncharacterized protein Z519_00977 [Cladophialophora bantiana CBS 173.52]KIW99314.1 hypothetical protein Z519_00977 [Cladophialophora bantiana CBS 173.52]
MSNWLNRIFSEPVSAPAAPDRLDASWLQSPLTPRTAARLRDPNAPNYRYQVNQKCIYERRLPGGSYITAHVQRLQSGFYDSPVIHEDCIDNVRFLAINFVFHPSSSTFRFKSAEINIALHHTSEGDKKPLQAVAGLAPKTSHDHGMQIKTMSNALVKSRDCVHVPSFKPPRPKFLRHAPHLLYGTISPETLNWNFNLAGSLGVSQGPASASFKPSYGVKSSYKIYEMMKIQGSVRTLRSWYGREYDIEDGELVWTLEENKLQKSGLPREFTFVMLLTKGSGGFEQSGDVRLELDVHPKVAGRLGAAYPSLITNLHQYQPFKREILDLDEEIGQVFEPQIKRKGFNFANIASSFDDFVWLPGTAYSTSDGGIPQSPTGVNAQQQGPPQQEGQQQSQQGSRPHQQHPGVQRQALPSGDTTLNLRVLLETSRGSPVPFSNQVQQQLPYLNLKVPSQNPSSRTQSPLPAPSITGSRESTHRTITIGSSRSVRKQRSRSELSKEYKLSPTQAQTAVEPQPSSSGHAASRPQRISATPAWRPFSYQEEEDKLNHQGRSIQMSTPEEHVIVPQTNSSPPIIPQPSPEFATPPSHPQPDPDLPS